jgi:hypothetical protein
VKWTTPELGHMKRRIRATLGGSVIEGLAVGWYASGPSNGRALIVDVEGFNGSLYLHESIDWTVSLLPEPIVLPTEPGTVIAIGKWWLVRLEPHNGSGPACWELLPHRDDETRASMERAGVKSQCVYSEEWVQAEAEQEGRFEVISAPIRRNAQESP